MIARLDHFPTPRCQVWGLVVIDLYQQLVELPGETEILVNHGPHRSVFLPR